MLLGHASLASALLARKDVRDAMATADLYGETAVAAAREFNLRTTSPPEVKSYKRIAAAFQMAGLLAVLGCGSADHDDFEEPTAAVRSQRLVLFFDGL